MSKKKNNVSGLTILGLILSILLPPVGLFISYFNSKEDSSKTNIKLARIGTIIGLILTILQVILIILIFIGAGLNNDYDNSIIDNTSKCNNVSSCKSDEDGDGIVDCNYINDKGKYDIIKCPVGSAPEERNDLIESDSIDENE